MSRMDLAEKLGVSPSRVSNWITGRNGPRGSMRERLAKALGVDSRWLMGDLEEKTRKGQDISELLESAGVYGDLRALPKHPMYNLYPGGGLFDKYEGEEEDEDTGPPTPEQMALGEAMMILEPWFLEAEKNPTVCGYLCAQVKLHLCHSDLAKLTGKNPNKEKDNT